MRTVGQRWTRVIDVNVSGASKADIGIFHLVIMSPRPKNSMTSNRSGMAPFNVEIGCRVAMEQLRRPLLRVLQVRIGTPTLFDDDED